MTLARDVLTARGTAVKNALSRADANRDGRLSATEQRRATSLVTGAADDALREAFKQGRLSSGFVSVGKARSRVNLAMSRATAVDTNRNGISASERSRLTGPIARALTPRTPTPPRQHEPEATGAVRLGEIPRGQAAQHEYFKDLVRAEGGTFKTGPNQFNLVGLRTNTPTTANGGNGSFDDRLAVVWKDAQGRPRVELLRYNTEPARNMSRYSADVNGDGRADQGRLTAGSYEYVKSSWKNGFCLRPVRDYRVQRDMNHNGRWDDSARTGGGASMLFHSGGPSSTGSAGCQTFPPSEWARFQRLIGAARGSFAYTLVAR
jgi:hypothetical protein